MAQSSANMVRSTADMEPGDQIEILALMFAALSIDEQRMVVATFA